MSAGLEERKVDVDVIEAGPAAHQIVHASGSARDFEIRTGPGIHRLIVCRRQIRNAIGRNRAGYDQKTRRDKLLDGGCGQRLT